MNSYGHQHGFFEARLWIDQESVTVETWAFELIPTGTTCRGTAEWALEHLQGCYCREDFLQRFELGPAKCWQVVFQGSMHGWFEGCSDKYDEEFNVIAFQAADYEPSPYEDEYVMTAEEATALNDTSNPNRPLIEVKSLPERP